MVTPWLVKLWMVFGCVAVASLTGYFRGHGSPLRQPDANRIPLVVAKRPFVIAHILKYHHSTRAANRSRPLEMSDQKAKGRSLHMNPACAAQYTPSFANRKDFEAICPLLQRQQGDEVGLYGSWPLLFLPWNAPCVSHVHEGAIHVLMPKSVTLAQPETDPSVLNPHCHHGQSYASHRRRGE